MKKFIVINIFAVTLFARLFCMNAASEHVPTLVYATCSLKGEYRPMMEDAFDNRPNGKTQFFAVYDGHTGAAAVTHCKNNLADTFFSSEFFATNKVKAFFDAFIKTDAGCTDISGTTAVCALLDGQTLYIANVGDSDAVWYKKDGTRKLLSYPHNIKDSEEHKRYVNLGGKVRPHEFYRYPQVVEYSEQGAVIENRQFVDLCIYDATHTYLLSMSRALGDHRFRPFISAVPFVNVLTPDGSEEFLVIGSDGLWDIINHTVVGQFIRVHMKKHGVTSKTVTPDIAQNIVDDLVKLCLKVWDNDNTTATIIFFQE